MRDWILTLIVAIPLTYMAVTAMGMEREIAPIGITFGMCVLLSGFLVRVAMDAVARRKRSK